jgi:hypothetical protein
VALTCWSADLANFLWQVFRAAHVAFDWFGCICSLCLSCFMCVPCVFMYRSCGTGLKFVTYGHQLPLKIGLAPEIFFSNCQWFLRNINLWHISQWFWPLKFQVSFLNVQLKESVIPRCFSQLWALWYFLFVSCWRNAFHHVHLHDSRTGYMFIVYWLCTRCLIMYWCSCWVVLYQAYQHYADEWKYMSFLISLEKLLRVDKKNELWNEQLSDTY